MSRIKRRATLIASAVLAAACAITATALAQSSQPIGAYTTKHTHHYASAPKLHPPQIGTTIMTRQKRLAPGYFMIANFKDLSQSRPFTGQAGPLILDHNLQPVWFRPVPENVYAANLEAQRYAGKPVLSWWQGVISPVGKTLSGQWYVVNQHYKQVATLKGADGWLLSLHEFLIRGTHAWVTAYKDEPGPQCQLTAPANVTITDSAVQEYDLRTGRLTYSWDACQHIPLSQSQTHPFNGSWDPYHVNSISLGPNGAFLTSMRSTWAAYLVDQKSSNIDWTLGGKDSTFTFAKNSTFAWQHDVELLPNGEVTLFNDDCCGIEGPGKFAPPNGPSRGMALKLDMTKHTASLAAQYAHHGLDTSTQGNMQTLPNGNVAVGWGQQPFFSEYNRSGRFLLDARMPDPDITYRTYVQKWVGLPLYPPSGVARRKKGKTSVFVSWNGATRVVSWKLLGGSSAKHLSTVATRRRKGFETGFRLGRRTFKVFRVEALDAKGHAIGFSKPFSVTTSGKNPQPSGSY